MLGAIQPHNVTKGFVTTTSRFAPELLKDPNINAHVPF